MTTAMFSGNERDVVVAGLIPAIHAFSCGQDVDHRDKPGDDGLMLGKLLP
jgi:hypothetical protein